MPTYTIAIDLAQLLIINAALRGYQGKLTNGAEREELDQLITMTAEIIEKMIDDVIHDFTL